MSGGARESNSPVWNRVRAFEKAVSPGGEPESAAKQSQNEGGRNGEEVARPPPVLDRESVRRPGLPSVRQQAHDLESASGEGSPPRMPDVRSWDEELRESRRPAAGLGWDESRRPASPNVRQQAQRFEGSERENARADDRRPPAAQGTEGSRDPDASTTKQEQRDETTNTVVQPPRGLSVRTHGRQLSRPEFADAKAADQNGSRKYREDSSPTSVTERVQFFQGSHSISPTLSSPNIVGGSPSPRRRPKSRSSYAEEDDLPFLSTLQSGLRARVSTDDDEDLNWSPAPRGSPPSYWFDDPEDEGGKSEEPKESRHKLRASAGGPSQMRPPSPSPPRSRRKSTSNYPAADDASDRRASRGGHADVAGERVIADRTPRDSDYRGDAAGRRGSHGGRADWAAEGITEGRSPRDSDYRGDVGRRTASHGGRADFEEERSPKEGSYRGDAARRKASRGGRADVAEERVTDDRSPRDSNYQGDAAGRRRASRADLAAEHLTDEPGAGDGRGDAAGWRRASRADLAAERLTDEPSARDGDRRGDAAGRRRASRTDLAAEHLTDEPHTRGDGSRREPSSRGRPLSRQPLDERETKKSNLDRAPRKEPSQVPSIADIVGAGSGSRRADVDPRKHWRGGPLVDVSDRPTPTDNAADPIPDPNRPPTFEPDSPMDDMIQRMREQSLNEWTKAPLKGERVPTGDRERRTREPVESPRRDESPRPRHLPWHYPSVSHQGLDGDSSRGSARRQYEPSELPRAESGLSPRHYPGYYPSVSRKNLAGEPSELQRVDSISQPGPANVPGFYPPFGRTSSLMSHEKLYYSDHDGTHYTDHEGTHYTDHEGTHYTDHEGTHFTDHEETQYSRRSSLLSQGSFMTAQSDPNSPPSSAAASMLSEGSVAQMRLQKPDQGPLINLSRNNPNVPAPPKPPPSRVSLPRQAADRGSNASAGKASESSPTVKRPSLQRRRTINPHEPPMDEEELPPPPTPPPSYEPTRSPSPAQAPSRSPRKRPLGRDSGHMKITLYSSLHGLSELLADSIGQEPMFQYLFPITAPRMEWVLVFAKALLSNVHSKSGLIAVTGTEPALIQSSPAVITAYPPGAYPPNKIKSSATKWNLAIAARNKTKARLITEGTQVFTVLEDNHPKERHWYIAAMGVDAQKRRKGIGSDLVEVVQKIAEKDEVPVVTKTSCAQAVKFYETLGFQSKEILTFDNAPDVYVLVWKSPKLQASSSKTGKS